MARLTPNERELLNRRLNEIQKQLDDRQVTLVEAKKLNDEQLEIHQELVADKTREATL